MHQLNTVKTRRRVYIACLTSYNAGLLHGGWIDAARDPDAILIDIEHMLAGSPIPLAEEWAIHDHEGFEGATVDEFNSVTEVSRLAIALDQHGSVIVGLLDEFGDLDEVLAVLEDRYRGAYPSRLHWAEAHVEETLALPELAARYFDHQAFTRDCELGGDVLFIEADGHVHVFAGH